MYPDEILSRFQVKRRSGSSAQCICPAHKDKEASLTVSWNGEKILMCCHAGCETKTILEKVGLTMKDLFIGERKESSIVYPYHNIETGKEEFVRIRRPGKVFSYGVSDGGQIRPGLSGRRRKSIPAVYGDIEKIRAADTVYYCEGEKDVDTVNRNGLTGLTCGSADDWTPSVKAILTGKNVVICQDNDDAGEKLSETVRNDLTGVARSVTVVIPCRKSKGADITDFFQNGGTVEELEKMCSGGWNEQPVPKLESAADFIKRDIPPLKHIVDGLVTEGVGILAGTQKTGKSWLCYQLAECVAAGKRFLGRKTTRGSALYFDLEQAEQLRQERLKIMMPEPPGNLYFINTASVIGDGFEQQLEGYLKQVPDTQLVIVDVLDVIADDLKRNEAPKRHAYRNISALKQIATKRHIAIICVMHFRKMQDKDDFMVNISGSNGWVAAADFAIGITRKRGESSATLQSDGRTTRGMSMQIMQDDKSMKWQEIGSTEDVIQQKRLQVFRQHAITQCLVKAVKDGGGHWEGSAGGLKGTAVFEQGGSLAESAIAISKFIKNNTDLFQKEYHIRVIDRNENSSKGAFFAADMCM